MTPDTPLRPRRTSRRYAATFIMSFSLAAAALVALIPAHGTRAGTPDQAVAAPLAGAAHAGHASAAAVSTAAAPDPAAEIPAAEPNTQSADAPPYRPAAVQRFHMDILERNVEIAPGKVVKVWTFGPKVPGPVLRVRVGDRVEVTVTNKGSIPHSLDLHAARIAPSRAFTDIAPGESKVISFTATSPGVFMYHCGTAPVVHHIANGMYGMIIVEPRGGLPKVDREVALVQSEFYVQDTPGQTADDAKLMAEQPDVVTFNGYAAQYKDAPIVVKRGETVRAFVLAAGPNLGSAFHVVGTVFDRAWIDGIYPQNETIGNQTLNLAASQGVVAEFRLDEEGRYPFVTHDFTNAAKGAVGVFATEHAPPAKPGMGH